MQNIIEPAGARVFAARPPVAHSSGSCSAPSFLKGQATPTALKAGQVLFRPGEPANGCYWLHSGVLAISVAGRSGNERIVALAGRGQLVGTLGLVDGLPRSTTARTVTPCQFGYVTRPAFVDALQQDPTAREFVMRQQAAMTRQVLERSGITGLPSARARIAASLLTFVALLGRNAGDDTVEIGGIVRQADLAAMASVTRESVSRVLGHWRRDGVLLPDPDGRLRLRHSLLAHEAGANA